jgi:hypothetical protein
VSSRARSARRLASILTRTAGVHTRVQYDRIGARYAVHWEGGPSTTEMQKLADEHDDDVPELDLKRLVWLRTEPSPSPYRRAR